MIPSTTFISNDGDKFTIKQNDLNKFPNSFLTCLTSSQMFGKFDQDAQGFKVDINSAALEQICYVYEHGKWQNPYLFENNYELDHVEGDFYDKCTFLGIPTDFEDPHEEQIDFDECVDWEEPDEPDDELYKYEKYMEKKELAWMERDLAEETCGGYGWEYDDRY